MKPNHFTDYDEDVDVLENEDIVKKIIVYDDDVNTFQHVIKCFVKYCKHTPEQAEQCAVIIHTKGKCYIKEGSYQDLLPIKQALTENGIDAKLEE